MLADLRQRSDGRRAYVNAHLVDPAQGFDGKGGVIVADGRIIAFCLASVNEDDWVTLGASNAYIDLIGVVRDRRGQGLAPLVISRTLQAIAEAGLEKAVLDVDTASPTGANTLYERLGFTATERSVALVARL